MVAIRLLDVAISATVITDASYCHATGVAGWAAWVKSSTFCKMKHGVLIPCANSAEAELYAAMNGIWFPVNAGATSILLQSDNMQVVNALNDEGGKWMNSLWRRIKAEHFRDIKVRAKHVKGHTNVQDARSFVNRWCDSKAKEHMLIERKKKQHGGNSKNSQDYRNGNPHTGCAPRGRRRKVS